MSVMKYASSPLIDTDISLAHWDEIHSSRTNLAPKLKTASINVNKFLLSHTTILASVMCESGAEDWLIKPECSHLVNNNHDAFENKVVEMAYKTFKGAFNFVEHYQNSKASKGYIVDAILRKITLGDSGVWVYYCDILVATDLKHKQLVDDIQSKRVRYLSMGCITDMITCSYCGAHNGGEGCACSHLANSKGRFLTDADGIPRRVAELCGNVSLPGGGVKFVEASWVATPAFPGAAQRSVVSAEWSGPESGSKVASQIPTDGIAKVASVIDAELPSPLDRSGHVAKTEMRRLR